MATAEDYAKWIVDNADKRGTPEFDTVAAAYQQARGGVAPPPQEEAPKEPPPKAPLPRYGSGEAMINGMTFGFAPEVVGAMDTLIQKIPGGSAPKSYAENVAGVRGARTEYDKNHPVAAAFSEIGGGGLATGPVGAGAKLIGRAIPAIGRAVARIPAYVRGIGTTAATGAAYGAGNADPGDRMAGAAIGAAEGAAFGAAIPGVVAGGRYLADKTGVTNLASTIRAKWNPQAAATAKMRTAMELDGLTTQQLITRLQSLGPQATIADTGGEAMRGLAAQSAGKLSPQRAKIIAMLEQRADGEVKRVSAALQRPLGKEDFFSAQDELLDKLRTQASPLYDVAYKANRAVVSPEIDKILETPSGQKALREAVKNMRDDMARVADPDPELTQALREAEELGLVDEKYSIGGVGKGLTLRTLDYVKRELDDMIGKELRAGANNKAGILIGNKNALLRELDAADKTGAYAKARSVWGGNKQTVDALEDGRLFLKLAPEEIRRTLAGLSAASQRAYRIGAVRSLLETAQKSGANAVAPNALVRDKLAAVMPDVESYASVMRVLSAEKTFGKTARSVQGSAGQSMDDPAAQRMAGTAGTMIGAASGHPIVASATGKIAQAFLPKSAAGPVAADMFNRNRAMQLAALDRMRRAAQTPVVPRGQNTRLSQALALAAAQRGGMAQE